MLTELADYAFARNGPVQRILGEHRPVQAQIAHQFAAFVETNRPSDHTTVSLNEQRGGLGKTAAYAVVMMLDIAMSGERAAYATFTRGLRNSIKEQELAFNSIVQDTLEAAGIDYEPVSIVEVQSPTAIISPLKCEAIRDRLRAGGIPLRDAPEVREFLDCVERSERPCEFADLYAVLPSLPCGWTELALALCPADRLTDDWKLVEESRQQAANRRTLLLLTHAMVIRNNLRHGRLFEDVVEQDEVYGVKTLVIDEADKLPSIANSALRFTVSRNEMADLAREAQGIPDCETLARLHDGLSRLPDLFTRVDVNYTKEDDVAVRLSFALDRIGSALSVLMRITPDLLVVDRLRLCRDNLRILGRIASFEHPIMRVALVRDPLGYPDIHVTMEIGGGRQLMSQMWRNPGFETISMVSALMTNMPPYANRYDRFRRDIDLDRTKGDRFLERPPLQPRYGQIGSIFVADRVPALLPTDTEEANLLRGSSLDGLAAQITAAATRREADERMVVLFQSYMAMDEVLRRLSTDIRERVVTRNRRHLPIAIQEFAERPYGIWCGVEWEGINFIDPRTRRTMVNALVITRLPLAPRDEIRAVRLGNAFDSHDRGQVVALFESVHACYRKLFHGVLLGIRGEHDRIDELWMLDPRWPLPTHVYQRQPPLITKSIDPRGLFSYFERIIEPFDVPYWHKIDAEGGIEPILEPAEAE